MIASFADQSTADIYNGIDSKQARRIPRDIWTVAKRKLDMVGAAHVLEDLRIPPQNKLHALTKNLAGKHAIRVNDQYRVVFRFAAGQAHDVCVTDYHY